MWNVISFVVVLTVVCASAFGGVERADRLDQAYLNMGALSQYASVGRVDGATTSSSFLASGTLIASDWVLTAAHVVKGATSLQFTVGGVKVSADKWVANPSYTGTLTNGYDIGLMHLSTPVLSISPAGRYTGSRELGTVGTSVGYGKTGTGLTGATTLDFQKRGGQNMVDAYYPGRGTSRIIMMDFDNPTKPADSSYGSSTPLNMEYLIAPGDSGGGLFADFGGVTKLIGVHSFGWAKLDGVMDFDYGDVTGDTRVSVFNSWIDSVITGGSTLGSTAVGKMALGLQATSIPEPASLLMLAAMGLAELRRRR